MTINVGYIRVSSDDQNPERQLAGIELAKAFVDEVSGKDTARPQLEAALDYVRAGDTLVVHSMDRLARNLGDLMKLVEGLTRRGIAVRFVTENLEFTGDDNPMQTLLMQIMGAVAQFERALIRERQREGIAIAKTKGIYKGRKRSLTADQAEQARQRASAGEKKAAIARSFGISRETLYGYLRA